MTTVLGAQFSISVEPQANLVRIEMGGFFSQGDMAAFQAMLESKVETLDCPPNEHLTLCDVSAMKIQTQEMVGAFSQIVGHPKFRSKRLAFVTGASLARLQTRRLTNRDGVEFFMHLTAAEAWLLG